MERDLLNKGVALGLYTKEELDEVIKNYPRAKEEWRRRALECSKSSTPVQSAQRPKPPRTDNYDFIMKLYNDPNFLNLTPDNFPKYRPIIEEQLFPAAESLRVPGIEGIIADYRLELIQAGMKTPSAGRLSYIKRHLERLKKT